MRKLSSHVEVLIAAVFGLATFAALYWFADFLGHPVDLGRKPVKSYNELVGPQHCRGKPDVFDCMRGKP